MPELDPQRALACRPPPFTTVYKLSARAMASATALDRFWPSRAPSHQSLAMWTHLVALDDRCMGPASARYMIRINGHLGAALLSAFPAMAWERQGSETILTGVLDQPGLYGVLAEIE